MDRRVFLRFLSYGLLVAAGLLPKRVEASHPGEKDRPTPFVFGQPDFCPRELRPATRGKKTVRPRLSSPRSNTAGEIGIRIRWQ